MDERHGFMPLTHKDVRERVQRIRDEAGDDESAHCDEDALYRDVLRSIASGQLTGTVAAELAAMALGTREIDFARWCA